MSTKRKMKHLLVVIPGITGSVLTHQGEPVWVPTHTALGKGFIRQSWRKLELTEDVSRDELDDGIRATQLMPDAVLLAGFKRIDGYTKLVEALVNEFDVSVGQNLLLFPYDWRRDNRVAARRLRKLVDNQLAAWRRIAGSDSRIIVLAHSMGGLVAKYFLEVLGGWIDCRALVCLGTPFRGSIKSLTYLCNGHPDMSFMSDMMRGYPSMYQLLPRSKVVKAGDSYTDIHDALTHLPKINGGLLADAFSFHEEISQSASKNAKDQHYNDRPYITFPIVGDEQNTLNSIELSNGNSVIPSNQLAPGIPEARSYGDGTVPSWSAIPREGSKDHRATFVLEMHGSLQRNQQIIRDLVSLIARIVEEEQLASVVSTNLNKTDLLSGYRLNLSDWHLVGHKISGSVQAIDNLGETSSSNLTIENAADSRQVHFQILPGGDRNFVIPCLPTGIYRAVFSYKGLDSDRTIHELFQVSEAES